MVPSYDRPDRLEDCLKALLAAEGAFPVIVVDDGSPRPLEPICAAFGPRVTCLTQRNAGPAAARNAGAAAARTPFLAFTDDDCRPRPGWVRALRAALEAAPQALIGGRVENGLPENVYAAASQTLCDHLYDYFDAESGSAPFFTSNNIACAKAAFDLMGGFDQSFPLAAAEDRDFGLRWRDRCGPLVYRPDAVIDHFHALDLRRFWRQHRNYGRGARHLHRVMDRRGDERPKREPLGFYLGLVARPLRKGERAGFAQSALLGLSQAAMVSGYVAEDRRAPSAG
ncbi:MAG: glycosyltransferase [Pseudomonadota bacterium]